MLSGGLDSVVILAMEQAHGREVWPIHVRSGLAWEAAEARAIDRVLPAAPFAGTTPPLTTLTVDMRDVYPPSHCAVAGRARAYDEPDETVYLEGRNITRPEFFEAMARAMSLGLAHPLELTATRASPTRPTTLLARHEGRQMPMAW